MPVERQVYLLTFLLPPPISLDILCTITSHPPVAILQAVESLVSSGHLFRYTDKGSGYYLLANFKTANSQLAGLPRDELQTAAGQAIAGIDSSLPEGPRKWLHLSHVYLIADIPLRHLVEIVKAGLYCQARNLLQDASTYYRLAIEHCDTATLAPIEQQSYIEAAIGLCICRENSLSPTILRDTLHQALELCHLPDNLDHQIRLNILLARTYLKTSLIEMATGHLDTASRMLESHDGSHELHLQLALAHSELLFWQGNIGKAIERYEATLTNFEEMASDTETLKNYIRLGWTYGVAGQTARSVGLIRRARRKARELEAHELERYGSLVLAIVLFDAGRIEEGAAFLGEVFATDEELLDDYILWPGYGKRAFYAYRHGDYEKAFEYHKRTFEKAKSLGVPHHRGPDNLEVMLSLEAQGFFNPEWNFEAEIERLLGWPDIFMKGVALRFRALKTLRTGGSVERIAADLTESVALLERAGGKIELAQAQLLLARIEINANRMAVAGQLLNSAWEIFTKVNPDLFPEDLKPFLDQTVKHRLWVNSLISIGDALGPLRARDELLAQIIKQAMRIAGAERGGIFLKQGKRLELVAGRNLEPSEIGSATFGWQTTLIDTVFESGQEMVKDGKVNRHPPAADDNGAWTACFPVQLQTRVLGVIFLDCALTRLQLPAEEIALLRLISNQAAIALENMTAYQEITDLNTTLQEEASFYREHQESSPERPQMIGRTEPFRRVLRLIYDVAKSDTTVLITGETGVGKDLVAQAIHQHSSRAQGPLVAVNLVSLSPELMASELFGHERGAFTGALASRQGRFELAAGGTLFLDDIDTLPLEVQAKLLRVLETKRIERVGSTRTLQTDFRLVAASNRNIEELVGQGLFRSDLYYRLNVFPLPVPPLRKRSDDIPILAHYFLKMFAKKFAKPVEQISPDDLETLKNYCWPGNIRELRHIIERSVLISRGSRLVIPPLESRQEVGDGSSAREILPLRTMEARHIVRALAHCQGKVSGPNGAAALLEIKPTTLYSMMKRLGVKKDGYRLPPDKGGTPSL
ncbi:MAG: sigma 54-interacting transcriptional regulator [Desulfopila sp.]